MILYANASQEVWEHYCFVHQINGYFDDAHIDIKAIILFSMPINTTRLHLHQKHILLCGGSVTRDLSSLWIKEMPLLKQLINYTIYERHILSKTAAMCTI